MPGTLYIVATPLGNLEDLGPRALRMLREADWIACEDTRRTGKLLAQFGLETPLVSFHEHNEEARSERILEALREGKNVALVSDAGTPLISDPGYRVVRECRLEGLAVIPVPGPSAVVAALSVSGLPTDRFHFAGFAAKKKSALRRQLTELESVDCTLVFYLSPHRLHETLTGFAEAWGDRPAFLVREMTKLHETAHFATLREIAESLADQPARGEYTLVVGGGEKKTAPRPVGPDPAAYVAGLRLTRGLSLSEAVMQAARDLGLKKQQVYRSLAEEDAD